MEPRPDWTGSSPTCADLPAGGAQPLKTAAELAATADVIIICVTGSPQVEEVVFGDNGILQTLKTGCVVVDCSTSLPNSTRRVAQAIAAKGGQFLDAAMTGTLKHADEGKLNRLVGGRAGGFESYQKRRGYCSIFLLRQ